MKGSAVRIRASALRRGLLVARRGISLLPSDWACEKGGTGSGPRYAGDAPGQTAHLDAYAAKTGSNAPLSAYAPQLLASMRQHHAHAGTGLTVRSSTTKVGNAVPALRLSAGYHGVWLQGAG